MTKKLDLIDIISIINARKEGVSATELARDYSVSIARISQIWSAREIYEKRWERFLGYAVKIMEVKSHENDVDNSDNS